MEARPLAELAIPGFQLRRRLAVADDRIDPARGFPPSSRNRNPQTPPACSAGCAARAADPWILARMRRDRSVQPSCTRSSSAVPPAWFAVKFSSQRCCQPDDRDARKPFRIDRRVGSDIDGGRRALEDIELLAGAREMRHALHGSGAGADDADALVGQLFHQRARRVAAGVIVIPAAGVERVSLEGLDAFDAGKFRHMQRPGAHADELRGEGIAAIGADGPARFCLVPVEAHDLGVEQRVVRRGHIACRCAGSARGFPAHAHISPTACGRFLRAAACRPSTPYRIARPDTCSSTRCRRSRRPSR